MKGGEWPLTTNSIDLVKQLADTIADRIMSGELVPGSRLRQEALAEEFSVSRTPIREALRQLETKGLVEHLPNQGATVRIPGAREIREGYQVRAELEGLAAELCVEWVTDEQVETLQKAQVKFASVVDSLVPQKPHASTAKNASRGWVESNATFHDIILTASRNTRLKAMVLDLHANFTRGIMMSTATMDGRAMRENVAQHEAIIRAIEQHDAQEARRAMRHHILRSGELAIWWLENTIGA